MSDTRVAYEALNEARSNARRYAEEAGKRLKLAKDAPSSSSVAIQHAEIGSLAASLAHYWQREAAEIAQAMAVTRLEQRGL